MGAFTSAIMGIGMGMQAINTFRAGQQAKDAYEYNANVYNAQANMIADQKALTEQEQTRAIAKLHGESVVAVTSSGYDMTGSALAVINDTLTQAYLDKAKSLYNLEVERQYAKSSAKEARRMGDNARTSGAIDAVSSVLTGGSKWYQQYGGFGKIG